MIFVYIIISFSIIFILLSIPIINFIFFYMDNQFSRVDKIVFIVIFIVGLFIIIVEKIYDYYTSVYSILFHYIVLYYVYIKIRYGFKNINLNEISLMIYMSAFLFFLCFIWILRLDDGSQFMSNYYFYTPFIVYYLLFSINIIIRARAFINKRRNKIKEENPHDEVKKPS
ncbi:hypothetical protein BKH42_00005 [Helicobacter sp. 13S00482-2]|uniref:hypothetical protein n=1 Tax=Helicobacter sp. 13S00482-2 TaxID=1476200 RepID=UPI000BA7A485|nr:hypothetical protein [Helicobacter sp. 13S00482-2]PAF54337.1 hypothetical protein BKH42_00005 [Helicobacter sp. 13S00482-2]